MKGTPNGVVASILLEELKAVYKDFDYEAIAISFSKNEQKEEYVDSSILWHHRDFTDRQSYPAGS